MQQVINSMPKLVKLLIPNVHGMRTDGQTFLSCLTCRSFRLSACNFILGLFGNFPGGTKAGLTISGAIKGHF